MANANPQHTLKQKVMMATIPRIAWAICKLIGLTCRYVHLSEEGAGPVPPQMGGVFCTWHRCIFPFSPFLEHIKPAVLISQSFDGDLITRFAEHFRYLVVRGSSSRGGHQAIRGMRNAVRQNYQTIFTVDGPRGPIYETKIGPVKVAELTGAPIHSFYMLPEHTWVLNTWDRSFIPKPFTRILIAWSRIFTVPKGCSGEELEAKRVELQEALDRARHLAESHCRTTPK